MVSNDATDNAHGATVFGQNGGSSLSPPFPLSRRQGTAATPSLALADCGTRSTRMNARTRENMRVMIPAAYIVPTDPLSGTRPFSSSVPLKNPPTHQSISKTCGTLSPTSAASPRCEPLRHDGRSLGATLTISAREPRVTEARDLGGVALGSLAGGGSLHAPDVDSLALSEPARGLSHQSP